MCIFIEKLFGVSNVNDTQCWNFKAAIHLANYCEWTRPRSSWSRRQTVPFFSSIFHEFVDCLFNVNSTTKHLTSYNSVAIMFLSFFGYSNGIPNRCWGILLNPSMSSYLMSHWTWCLIGSQFSFTSLNWTRI